MLIIVSEFVFLRVLSVRTHVCACSRATLHVCVLLVLILCFSFFLFPLFCYSGVCPFFKEREKDGTGLGMGRGALGGDEEGQTLIRIYCMKKKKSICNKE